MHAHQEKGNENAHDLHNSNATPARQFHNPRSHYQTKQGAKPPIEAKQRPVVANYTPYKSVHAPVQRKVENVHHVIPGDYYNEKGYYLGSDGKNDNKIYIVEKKADRKTIKKNHKKGKDTQLSEVKSARLISTAAGLDEALDVLRRTQEKTDSDSKGGLHEEVSIVMNDGTVVRGKAGNAIDYAKDTYAGASLPALPQGYKNSDVAVGIHSHPTRIEDVGGVPFGSDATQPTTADANSTLRRFKTSIIVGRLGLTTQRTSNTGQKITTKPSLGVVVYHGMGSLSLSIKRAKRIIEDQIARGKYKKE